MNSSNFFQNLRTKIADNDLDGAIWDLRQHLNNSPKLDEAIVQSARHSDIMRRIRLGIVEESEANMTKNQIRVGLLELIRDLETLSPNEVTVIDDYKKITEKIEINRGVGTSQVLKNKSSEDLDAKELDTFFKKKPVAELLESLPDFSENTSIHEKLVSLKLGANGHLYKGTFLCLGKGYQINTVCPTAIDAKFILFKGTDRDIILDLKPLNGNLMQQFSEMMMLLRKHIPLGRDREKSEDVYEIPIAAIREFVSNAFIHRDYGDQVRSYIQVEMYDDRLEIKSPGHLPEGLDLANIEGAVTINPTIAAIFHLYQHTERAGTGIRIAQKRLENHGLKPAKIENINSPKMVKVTIFRNNAQTDAKPQSGFWIRLLRKIGG